MNSIKVRLRRKKIDYRDYLLMKYAKFGIKGEQGITLIEVSLALALIAAILVSLTNVLNISLKNWEFSGRRNELTQNGRVAMDRIISDLRYAVSISEFNEGVLQFDTRYLENEDDSIEVIRYDKKSDSNLYRSVDAGSPAVIADWVDSFNITLRDANGQSVALASQAAFAEISLVLISGNDTFTLTSSAHMRNYSP